MNISHNWLNTYLSLEREPAEIAEILTGLGLEVGSVDEWISVPGGLEGIVIGEVLECIKHPNADRLSLTKVNIGTGEDLSIVCGAPNVAAGQKVLVAPVGSTIHPTNGEPFTIDARKVRGEMSGGMICAADEIGLGTDHSGILVLPGDAEVGILAKDYYDVTRDWIYDVDLTPNRSDATSHIGVAEDLAAYLSVEGGEKINLNYPDFTGFKIQNRDYLIEVVVENTEACPRYAGLTIHGVKVGESPAWLKNRLKAIGVRPVNNVVDATNFVLHEMGQPLHAFDADKISGNKIIVKTLPENTEFQTLDEQVRKLSAEDLMICDGKSNGLCIAGVFGGIGSGVTAATKTVFLESAHFNPQWVRRTSMRHILRTEAARCFEKGTNPNMCVTALKRVALIIRQIAGGEIASDIVDIYPEPILPAQIEVRLSETNRLLGIDLVEDKLEEIFKALNFDFSKKGEDLYQVAIPTNKSDVLREVDVIEEVLRVYGINNVPLKKKISTTFALAGRPGFYEFRRMLANFLAGKGLSEMMGLSMISDGPYQQATGTETGEENLVRILNTSNESLDLMRPAMLTTALEAMRYNTSRQQQDLQLFEFGRSYTKVNGEYIEREHLTISLSDKQGDTHWLGRKEEIQGFYRLKGLVDAVLHRCGVSEITSGQMTGPLSDGITYSIGEKELVKFGVVGEKWLKAYDIKSGVLYAEFDLSTLFKLYRKTSITVQEISRFPAIRRDLALMLPESVEFEDLSTTARKELGEVLREVSLFDVYRNKEQMGADMKSYALHLVFEDREKTLRDEEVDKAIDRLLKRFEEAYSARLR